VTTREDVHVLTLFEEVSEALAWQEYIYRHLPPLPNNERAFGAQLVVDAEDDLVRLNERLLLTATDLSLEHIIEETAGAGGLAIPAHVDRPAFSLLSQLGFVPPGLDLPVLEVSRHADVDNAAAAHPSLAGRRLVQSSDAHCVEDVGAGRTVFWLEEPTLAELRLACREIDGRRLGHKRQLG
jgi:PHP family Zn ribbon phosphoesterase